MKKYVILVIGLLFAALCINVFGQSAAHPFVVKKTGTGERSIVFIPGFASSGEVWAESVGRLNKEYVCYSLTMAGFAGVAPQPDASFENWKSAIATFIKDSVKGKVILVGHSMGGGLALAIAAGHPELVEKVVVVDALPCLAALMNPAFRQKANNDCPAMTAKLTSMSTDDFEKMQQQSAARLVQDTSMRPTVVRWSMQSDRATFANMYCDFSNVDLRDRIATIQCPALVLLEPYFLTIQDAIKDQYKALKNADLQFGSKGLHFIMYDDKDWYFARLNSFLTK